MRWGWPERVGGLGGSPLLRTELGAAMAARNLADPGVYSLVEVLAPTLIDYADPDLAADWVPKLLSGEEMWCQGFSEPGTGSDLATLSCRAVPDGGDPATADTWVINGQKVWTSLAQYSQRCVLLTRTGTPESRHRGITAFFLDLDTPGITISPIEMINGEHEFTEVFFDDVAVPADRILGGVDGGWAVAMSILPYERSSCFWQRIAYLYPRVQRLVDAVADDDDRAAEAVGNAFLAAPHRPEPVAGHAAPPRGGGHPRRRHVDRQGARGDGGADALRRDPQVHPRGDRARRHRDRRHRPHRVPVLARRDDLRRHGRGAAQHHRPTPARPGGGGLMDAAERALLEETVRDAVTTRVRCRHARRWRARRSSGGSRCSRPSLAMPCEIVFTALGLTNAAAGVLDDVVAAALGRDAPRRPRRAVAPVRRRGALRRRSPATRCGPTGSAPPGPRPRPRCSSSVTVRWQPVPVTACAVSPVDGVDPIGGLAPGPGRRVRCRDRAAPRRGLGRRGGRRSSGGRPPGRRGHPHDARPRPHPRARPGAVRSADRVVPGRASPPRRGAGRDRGPRGDARRGVGRRHADHRGAREGRRRAARPARSPRTASRCWRGSASRPTTRSTCT